MTSTELITLFRTMRLDLSHEKATQRDIAEVLNRQCVEYEQEVRLSEKDIVDFMVGSIAIEVKMKTAVKQSVYRQLVRYAQHERVSELILLSNLSMNLPEQLNGKPLWFCGLSEGWL